MEKLNYNTLFIFNVVATEGGLNAAAKKLDLSPSTLSERIKNLEAELGKELFLRDISPLKLNDTGKHLHAITREMFILGNKVSRIFDTESVTEKITLNVGISSSISKGFSARHLHKLLSDKQILLRIRFGDYSYLLRELRSLQIDILISDVEPETDPDQKIESELVQTAPLVVVAKGDQTALIELYRQREKEFPLIAYPSASEYRWIADRYFELEGYTPDVIAEIDDIQLIAQAVDEGCGIAVLPATVIQEARFGNRLTALATIPDDVANVFVSYQKERPFVHISKALEILRSK